MGIFVDKGYVTGLGTPFFDRRAEAQLLGKTISERNITVVYGPRNVGKSELVRYWGWRLAGARLLVFPGDLIRTREVVEGLGESLAAWGERVRDALVTLVRERAGELGLLDLVYLVVDALRGFLGETVVFIDEFHLLPRYVGHPRGKGYGEALADLEALAHRLAKGSGEHPKVVLTVSEGFIAKVETIARVHGYNVGFFLVEHMDERHFRALHEHYAAEKGCAVEYGVIYGLVGGAPGYLPELCRGWEAVESLINVSKNLLEDSLVRLRENLTLDHRGASATGIGRREVMDMVLRVVSGVKLLPLEEPLLYKIGQMLTDFNIVYPKYNGDNIEYRPQLPLYRHLLEIVIGEKASSILEIKPSEVMKRIQRRNE